MSSIWIPTLATLGQGGFMTMAGHLEEWVGVRATILLGCAIMTSGVFLTYFTIQISMATATLTYGFMFGLGIALAYAPPMAVAMNGSPAGGDACTDRAATREAEPAPS